MYYFQSCLILALHCNEAITGSRFEHKRLCKSYSVHYITASIPFQLECAVGLLDSWRSVQ